MNSLFVEASAKTAVGVTEAFREVVAKILDTPELWAPVTPGHSLGGKGMPGEINLQDQTTTSYAGGCSC